MSTYLFKSSAIINSFLYRSVNILYIQFTLFFLFIAKSFLNYFFIFLNHFLAATITTRFCSS